MTARFQTTEAFARKLDAADPLKRFRSKFLIPPHQGKPSVYLCGHSLGLQPKTTRASVLQELEDWAKLGVEGHFQGRAPWFSYHERFRKPLARLVGAKPREAVAMNSLSVNLHLLLASFYRPTAGRFKILTDAPAFPSDLYAFKSQIAWHGFGPEKGLVSLAAREGEPTLRVEDVEAAIEREGEQAALLVMNGVNFLTGQAFPIGRITAAAKNRGIRVGWDLAHAVGNIPLSLHDWDADFAVWCSYKYLNSGPGAVGGCFVHERYGTDTALPRLAGWWGHDPKTRFRMQLEPDFVPQGGGESWQVSNPQIFSLAPLKTSLDLFDEAGMPALRKKSERLSAYLLYLLDLQRLPGRRLLSPREPGGRGCQLSLEFPSDTARSIHRSLMRRGIVADLREPNIIRVAPVPLYNTFHDVWTFANALERAG